MHWGMSESRIRRRVAVLVLACASDPYGAMIRAIRSTWGSRRVEDVDVYYLYGNPESGRPAEELARFVGADLGPVEADGIRQIDNVLIAGCADSIRQQEDCLLRKRLIAFGYLCERGDYDFVHTVCATSYLDLDRLKAFVASMPTRRAAIGAVGVDQTGTTPFVSGASLLLTADVACALGRHRDAVVEQNRFGFRDDVAIGYWIAKHLSAVPVDRIIEDVRERRPLSRDHVFLPATHTWKDFVSVPQEEQRATRTAYHYHFHSKRPEEMRRFHTRFFCGRSQGTRRRHRRVDYVQIFGERCSGTSYLARLVEKNFAQVELTRAFGFKHWYIKDHEPRGRPNRSTDFECVRRLDDADDTLFLVIHRNALDWLRSLHAKPYHAPGHWNLSFSEFIRKPWLSFEPKRASPLWPADEEGGYFIEEAENVVRLRSRKIRHFLNLEGRVPHVAFLRYEALVADLGVLERVAEELDIPLRNRPLADEAFYFGGGAQTTFPSVRKYPPISPEDLAFIRRSLDWELESRLGYEWPESRWVAPRVSA